MMFKVVLAVFFVVGLVAGAKFPAKQRKCSYKDSACVLEVANEIVKLGPQGYPELGLPVFEPLKIDRILIDQSQGNVLLKIELTNFVLKGLSEVKFTKLDGLKKNMHRGKVDISLKYPTIGIEGPYKMDGKVLILPVQGNGKANLTFIDNTLNIKILTKTVERQGKTYLQMDRSKLKIDSNNVFLHFENLFNGNKELGDTTNLFFNENWREILKEIGPEIDSSISDILVKLVNNVFSNIPYDEFFED